MWCGKLPKTVKLEWCDADEKRLSALLLAMHPYTKVMAEFPDHDANVVRDAVSRLLCDNKGDPDPLDRARAVLGARVVETSQCPTGLRLDRRPASPAQIIDEANRLLRRDGRRQIAYPDGVI